MIGLPLGNAFARPVWVPPCAEASATGHSTGLVDSCPTWSLAPIEYNRARKIDRRALAEMLDPALCHPDAIRNPHGVPFTCWGGTDTGSCPDAC